MKSRRRRSLGSHEREILEKLSAGDLVYGFLLSAHSTRRMYRLAHERAAYRYRRKRALERLIENKWVQRHGEQLSITGQGKTVLDQLIATNREKLSEATWDAKWRIVTFDIPEIHAGQRRRVRAILERAGFAQLQKSVWIFPYECAELAAFIKHESHLAPFILYGVLERIEEDGKFKKRFRL